MTLRVGVEPVDSPGVLACLYAAQDELDRRYGPGTDAQRVDLAAFAHPQGAYLVAREDGHLAGAVAIRRIGEPADRLGEIKRLWVRPDLRRRGVASELMSAAADEASRLGFERLFLETGGRQPEAVALYHRLGWQRVERFPDGVEHYEEGIKFSLVLTPSQPPAD